MSAKPARSTSPRVGARQLQEFDAGQGGRGRIATLFDHSAPTHEEEPAMAEAATKLPVKTVEKATAPASRAAWPFESLHREIDRLFEEFDRGFGLSPFRRPHLDIERFWRREPLLAAAPAVDVAEKDKEYEITAELPGMDESNIEVKLSNGMLTITGEKKEEKEEKKKDYYLSERRYGSFERSFQLPEGVDADKIEAKFTKGVLKVVLPKTAEAQKSVKKIAVKAS
jgi:HSP20 family protein